VSGAVVTEPVWVGLLGTVLFYGVVLSEATTMALRRRRLDLSAPGMVL